MHPIIYDVAVSIDGYISGVGGDVSGFAHEGAVVDDYLARLKGYHCALIGRASYEFGYGFGLKPGMNPYPHMRSIVVSSTLELPKQSAVELWRSLEPQDIADLKQNVQGPIYLCGGGQLAAKLLAFEQIDILRLKRAPIILGGGTRLFAGDALPAQGMTLQSEKSYGDGTLFQEFHLKQPA